MQKIRDEDIFYFKGDGARRKRQNFRMIPALALVLMISLGVGLYLRHYYSNKLAQEQSQLNTKIDGLNQKIADLKPQQDSSNTSNYFVALTVFGVKFPYPSTSTELSFTNIGNKYLFDADDLSASIAKLDPKNSCTPGSGIAGYLSRYTGSPILVNNSEILVSNIGGYSYYYGKPAACSNIKAVTDAQEKANQDLYKYIKDLQLIQ